MSSETNSEEKNNKDSEPVKAITSAVLENDVIEVTSETWNGEQYLIDGGTLIVHDDTDPTITLQDGRLVYVELSSFTSNQWDTFKKPHFIFPRKTISLEDCYIDERIDVDDIDVCIIGGGYNEIIYGRNSSVPRVASEGIPTMNIEKDTKIKFLHIGGSSNLFVTSGCDCGAIVNINEMIVEGRACISHADINNITVDHFGCVQLENSKITELHVRGVVEIKENVKIERIYL